MLFPENAFNLPMFMKTAGNGNSGEKQAELINLMRKAGCKNVTQVIYEGMPHHFADKVPYYKFIPDMLKLTRDEYPDRVKYGTNTLRYNKAYWVTIDSLEKEGVFATVDAQWRRSKLTVKTGNIDKVTFDLSKAPKNATIAIDGAQFKSEGKQTCSLVKQDGKWQVTDQSMPKNMKRGGVSGPIGDALTSKFLVVYGSDADMELAQAETDAMRNPLVRSNVTLIDFPYKKADEVTAEDIKSCNLLLFGTTESNPLIKKYMSKMPITCTNDGVKAGTEEFKGASVVFIAPNPENPARYVVVWTGSLLRTEGLLKNGGSHLMTTLPDYLIFDDKSVLKAGLFNDNWKL